MIKAYAKINLGLNVLGKLENGYHELEMLNIKISLHDEIFIEESKTNKVTYESFEIEEKSDLIFKFINDLTDNYQNLPKFKIHIKKNIPVGSGMGGTSSDIASIINYINNEYNLNLTYQQLIEYVKPYGTDICYCLFNKPAIVKGVGDVIEFVDLKLPNSLILVNPKINISTKEIYQNVKEYSVHIYNKEYAESLKHFKSLKNDLEKVVRSINPTIDIIIKELNEDYPNKVRLTGSGSTIVLYSGCRRVLKKVKDMYPNYDVQMVKVLKGE